MHRWHSYAIGHVCNLGVGLGILIKPQLHAENTNVINCSFPVGHFGVTVPCASASKGVNVLNLSYKNEFDSHEKELEVETHFHVNDFAPRLVLTQAPGVYCKMLNCCYWGRGGWGGVGGLPTPCTPLNLCLCMLRAHHHVFSKLWMGCQVC